MNRISTSSCPRVPAPGRIAGVWSWRPLLVSAAVVWISAYHEDGATGGVPTHPDLSRRCSSPLMEFRGTEIARTGQRLSGVQS